MTVPRAWQHALLGFGARDGLFAGGEIFAEKGDDARVIKIAEDRMGVREINKVPSFFPLQQCPEFRGENFFLGESFDIGAAREPGIFTVNGTERGPS